MKETITTFRENYYFLSNMFPCTIVFENQTYKSAESAFQAAKCIDKKDRIPFTEKNGYEAKKLGRKVPLRPDWEAIKTDVMYNILKIKFSNPDLKEKLLQTKNKILIEENTWNDTFWGVNKNTKTGENNLGKILMKIREELQQKP